MWFVAFEFFIRFLFQSRVDSVIRRVSWLTLFGMTLSISSLVLVISVMNALNDNVRERTLALEPHLIFQKKSSSVVSSVGPSQIDSLREDFVKQGWRHAEFETQDLILRSTEGRFQGAQGRGYSAAALEVLNQDLKKIAKVPSQRVSRTEVQMDRGEVWLGADLAEILDVRTGDEIFILTPDALLLPEGEVPRWDRVRIRGLLRTNVNDLDSQSLFYFPNKSFVQRDNPSLRKGYAVWLPLAEQADTIQKKWSPQFPQWKIQTWKDRHSAIFFALLLEKSMITLFLTLAALIASMSFVAVMSLLVNQRRKEFGILETLGLSPSRTRILFFKVGLLLAVAGLSLGLLIGGGVSWLLELYPLENVLPSIYFDTRLPARFDGFFSICVTGVGLGLSSLGAWWVSQSIRRLSPTQLLR